MQRLPYCHVMATLYYGKIMIAQNIFDKNLKYFENLLAENSQRSNP